MKNLLVIIPARAGSKRIKNKNTRLLNGKPLFMHTFEAAREVFQDSQICVSTDDKKILEILKEVGYSSPFIRPAKLSGDTAGSKELIEHAIKHYENTSVFKVDHIMLLQPTSPFRSSKHIIEAINLFEAEDFSEMLVSACKSKSNPFFTQRIVDENGYLKSIMKNQFTRFQDAPKLYDINGAIYLFSKKSFKKYGLLDNPKIKLYEVSLKMKWLKIWMNFNRTPNL